MKTITKTIENLIKLELGEDYSVLENVFIEGTCRAINLRIVLIRYARKDYHIIRHWGDGSYSFIGCLWTREEAYEELHNQFVSIVK